MDRPHPVALVGAGPGAIEHLTVRARDAIAAAEVLVYDALVDARLLAIAPRDCLKLDVSKRGGQPSTPQNKINALLVRHAQTGKRVVRLKSGDPLIFGRAREEINALQTASCPVEVIPGISSAFGAPSLVGIPLTDRDLSSSFVVVSAHDLDALDWWALARVDTFVALMGGRQLGAIATRLIQHGHSESTPVAVIRHGSRPEQQVWTGTLADIEARTAGESLSPAVIVVGAVVQRYLQWGNLSTPPQAELPLANKTVLVTRAATQASDFVQLLAAQGARTVDLPALEIRAPSSWEDLDAAIAELAGFDWLILTSANGVEAFNERLLAAERDMRALAGVKVAAVGTKTAAALRERGLVPDFIPSQFVADALVAEFPEAVAGQRFLFPRVETGGRELLVQTLRDRGAEVTEVAAYQSACPPAIAPDALYAIQNGEIDIATFASSKTVKNFCRLLLPSYSSTEAMHAGLAGICIAAIGPQTALSCRELLDRCDVEASEHTLGGLAAALVQWARDRERTPH